MKKLRRKSLVGWAYKEWTKEFRICQGFPHSVDIPGIYSKLTKDDIVDIGSEGKVKVRITIEELK